jgi:hypothetical protein
MGQQVRCGPPSKNEAETGYRHVTDESVRSHTGKSWDEWFALLDEYGVEERGHSIAVKHLVEHFGLSPEWAQAVAIRYEDARGLRTHMT